MTRIKYISSVSIILLVSLAILSMPVMAVDSVGTVTRSISSTTVSPGESITITLTPSDSFPTSPGWGATETLPDGFVYVSTDADSYTDLGNNQHRFSKIGSGVITYTVTAPSAEGTYTISGTFVDADKGDGTTGGDTEITVTTATATPTPTPSTGGSVIRILDEKEQGCLGPHTWNAQNYQGFWYDLDTGESSETLELVQTGLGRQSGCSGTTIEDQDTFGNKGGLVYTTTERPIQYEVSQNIMGASVENGLDSSLNKVTYGEYYAKIGWMSEEYVALNGNAKKLAKLLIEQKESAAEKKTLTVGESWQIGDWTLQAQSIDAKADPRQVWLVLSYKGQKLDDKVVSQGEVYTYIEKSIAGESDVPLFVTYIDSVFAGATTDMVQLRFTWAISRDITEIKSGDKIGVFKMDATRTTLTGKLDSSIDLSPDSTETLAGNFVLRVADDDEYLRFMPDVEYTQPGTYEERGFVLDERANSGPIDSFTWDAQSFRGFWYDLDDGVSGETLELNMDNLGKKYGSTTTIDDQDSCPNSNCISTDGGLVYKTEEQPIQYEVSQNKGVTVENGLDSSLNKATYGEYYAKLGWLGEEYVALNGNAKKISKLLIEQKESAAEKKTLTVGETWQIGDWTLQAQSIDAKATPRQVWLVLSYKGQKLDDKVVSQGEVYTYIEKSIAGESDVPLFVTYVDSVFAGATTDMVQLRFTWAISRDITEIKSGDKIGVFKMDATRTMLKGKLDSSVDLTQDSVTELAGNFKIRVADDDEYLRFYPFIEVTVGEGGAPSEVVTATETPSETPTGNETGVETPTATETPAETAAPTTTATEAPAETPTKTEAPAETPTEETPGFEAIFAIFGLLAVAFLVLRQRR